MNVNEKFWRYLQKLVDETEIVIDRPKGSKHPKFPETVYIVDYGYLKNTNSSDGMDIDVYFGSGGTVRSVRWLLRLTLLKEILR